MSRMLRKLFGTPRGTVTLNVAVAAVGVLLAILIDSPRVGTIVFLAVTAVESGVFSLIYGFRSSWREVPAARAVFWVVLAYFGVAAHLLTLYLWETRWWWSDDLREVLYLGLAVAGLNLVLTLNREVGPPWLRAPRDD
jgi:hypothetical protein